MRLEVTHSFFLAILNFHTTGSTGRKGTSTERNALRQHGAATGKDLCFLELFPKDSAGMMEAFNIIGAYGKQHGDILLEMCKHTGWLGISWHSQSLSNEELKSRIEKVYRIMRSASQNASQFLGTCISVIYDG